jgi:NAD(P)-dependent dehydrogenase (short-subunit alcohol dehydrogenase family)
MKSVIITGANVGIGFAAAKFIAAHPDWHVILACRNEAKAKAAISQIRQSNRNASVSFAPLDLFSLASVRGFPKQLIASEVVPIHGLILNAGGINMKAKNLEFSEDGFERTFSVELPRPFPSRECDDRKDVRARADRFRLQ